MHYSRVHIDAVRYVLGPEQVTTRALEDRLTPLYRRLGIPTGQIEAMTGIVERRMWPPGFSVAEGATRAAQAAIEASAVPASALDVVVYGGVCREHFEPATACHVAGLLAERGHRVAPGAVVYDVGNACLGMLHGMVEVANRIELGQARAGLVVGCESAREIVDTMIGRMLAAGDLRAFKYSAATLTGGSGAAAMILTSPEWAADADARRLVGGVFQNAPEHHQLCSWGIADDGAPLMQTDAVEVLTHGVALGQRAFAAMLEELEWSADDLDASICHQIGSGHRDTILPALGLSPERDFVTYERCGNMGSVALPAALAMAEERGFIERGQRIGLLGIGSGLNCLMLGVRW